MYKLMEKCGFGGRMPLITRFEESLGHSEHNDVLMGNSFSLGSANGPLSAMIHIID